MEIDRGGSGRAARLADRLLAVLISCHSEDFRSHNRLSNGRERDRPLRKCQSARAERVRLLYDVTSSCPPSMDGGTRTVLGTSRGLISPNDAVAFTADSDPIAAQALQAVVGYEQPATMLDVVR